MVRMIVDSSSATTLAGDLQGIAKKILREEYSGSYMDSKYTIYNRVCVICGAGIDEEEDQKIIDWGASTKSDVGISVHEILNEKAGGYNYINDYCMRCIGSAHDKWLIRVLKR